MPTAFVFAGGGSLGAVEVGMLRALEQRGVRADFVVGSSVGAINAVYFATRPTPDGVDQLEHIWRGVRRRDVFPFSTVGAVLGLIARRGHLIGPARLRGLLERHLADRRLEEGPLPCHVVTTDLLAGIEVRLAEGPAVEALLASTAIPGVFPPVCNAGRHLVDGGVTNNTPIAAAVELGASRVIVLPTGIACALATPPRGMVAVALHALTVLISSQLASDVERLRDQAEIVVVPPLCPLDVSSHDFSRGGELIDRSARATARWLEDGGLRNAGLAGALRPHHH